MWCPLPARSLPYAGLLSCLLACPIGCGSLPPAQPYATPASLLALPDVAASSAPAFVIDDDIDLNIPCGSFGIGQSGGSWTLTWEHDQPEAVYSGDLYCPKAGQLLVALSSMVPAADVQLLSGNHVRFSIRSEPNVRYRLLFETTLQPLGLSLQIDGQPATSPRTAFASGRQLASVDTMPFRLVGSLATASMLGKP